MYKQGTVLIGKVKSISDYGVTVKVNHSTTFFIPISLISDFKRDTPKDVFRIGERINFIVETDDSKNNRIGNFKINHSAFLKGPFVNEINETEKGFTTLRKRSDKLIDEFKKGK